MSQYVKKLPAMQEIWFQSLEQKNPLEREWQPTLVFLPGEFCEQKSLADYSPHSHKESDMAEPPTLVKDKLHCTYFHVIIC